MNLQSIRVKSSIPIILLGFTLIIAIFTASALIRMQSQTLEAQSEKLLKAVSLVLNADRDLYQAAMAQTYIVTGIGNRDANEQERAENAKQVTDRFLEYKRRLSDYQDLVGRFDQFDSTFANWKSASDKLVTAARAGEDTSALQQQADSNFDALRDVLDQAGEAAELKSQALQQQLAEDVSTFQGIAFVIIVIVAGISIWFSYVVPKNLTSQIRFLTDQIADIADGDGDLTARVDIKSKDEFGELGTEFNRFVANLNELIKAILSQSEELKSLTHVLSDSAVKTKTINDTLNSASETIVSAVHEMSASSKEMADIATISADEAVTSTEMAITGIKVVGDSSSSIAALSKQMDKALISSKDLQKSSEDIASVLDVIRSIAEQTNLLALNAAIEAARAGEQGRGFAVVADEVRTLATRTQESTDHIQGMIEQLQTNVNFSASVISSGKEEADATMLSFEQASEVFKNLQQSSGRVNEMSTQTAQATQEQTKVSDEISQNLFELNEQTNSASTVAQTSEQLATEIFELSNNLSQLVSRFKV
ncbi:methyl-accepting chemotaxis protein [Shewanella maritima]|uniref:methyl-accepting chemotaxis protein n=1 Tax=Shewanella maritima TaxID=2520507 RepID=UPI0037353BD7